MADFLPLIAIIFVVNAAVMVVFAYVVMRPLATKTPEELRAAIRRAVTFKSHQKKK
jgi:hypothetical protein